MDDKIELYSIVLSAPMISGTVGFAGTYEFTIPNANVKELVYFYSKTSAADTTSGNTVDAKGGFIQLIKSPPTGANFLPPVRMISVGPFLDESSGNGLLLPPNTNLGYNLPKKIFLTPGLSLTLEWSVGDFGTIGAGDGFLYTQVILGVI